MEDASSMCDRILKTLESIFQNDPDLREFSVVHTETNTKNKSPVLYEEHNIGLESWCIKYIYRYACKELFDIRHLLRRRKLTFDRKQNLNHLLIGVLLINPDVTTFWNMKRELVDDQILMLDNELKFTKILLSHKAKSNETFTYRRWLLNKILLKSQNNRNGYLDDLFVKELEVCEMASEKSPNNYHAWNHRKWSIENFFNKITDNNRLILDELEFSYQWIMKHVSEHTGYNYRQYLIDFVKLNNKNSTIFNDYVKVIVDYFGLVHDNELRNLLILLFGKNNVQSLENNNQLINFVCLLLYDLLKTTIELHRIFPGHESLWYHRRYLVYHLLETIYNYYDLSMKFNVKLDDTNLLTTNQLNIVDFDRSIFCINNEKQFRKIPNKISESLLYRRIINNETDFIQKNICKYFENEFAKRYEKWLKLVLCLDLS